MRFYTKDWYELMQRQNYTLGVKKLPDRGYTDREIEKLYMKKRARFIAREKSCYNTPPLRWALDDFQPESLFGDDDMQYIAQLAGTEEAPKNAQEFSAFLTAENQRARAQWESRPPFDEAETGRLFDEMYRERLKYAARGLPAWVAPKADKRLLAMDMMTESVYAPLHREELANRAAWRKIECRAEKVLSEHRRKLPQAIVDGFRFHDAEVLKLQKRGGDYEMPLNVEGAGGFAPYMKVTFSAASVEREPGIRLCVRRDENGAITSNCRYLYDEIYAVADGVEVHMLLCTGSLKYLTVRCRDVHFEPMEQAEI